MHTVYMHDDVITCSKAFQVNICCSWFILQLFIVIRKQYIYLSKQ